jgi:hypothetical protein
MGLLALAGSCSVAPAYAHDGEVKRCFAHDKPVTKLGESILPNGLLMEQYDTNSNGKVDVVTLSTLQTTRLESGALKFEHSVHPVFYLFDKDEDQNTDSIYVDKKGDGVCSEIVLYHDFYAPQTPNAPHMDTGKEASL